MLAEGGALPAEAIAKRLPEEHRAACERYLEALARDGIVALRGWALGAGGGRLGQDEHGVAEAVEAVALADGLGVGLPDASSCPAKAETSMSRVERGRWKLVSSASTTVKA